MKPCAPVRPSFLNLHAHKTGALIIAAVELGCAAAGVRPDTDTRKALVRYAAELGLVFQIVDDILDVTSTTEELGKPVGSDADNDKTTFYHAVRFTGRTRGSRAPQCRSAGRAGCAWPRGRFSAPDGSGAAGT